MGFLRFSCDVIFCVAVGSICSFVGAEKEEGWAWCGGSLFVSKALFLSVTSIQILISASLSGKPLLETISSFHHMVCRFELEPTCCCFARG